MPPKKTPLTENLTELAQSVKPDVQEPPEIKDLSDKANFISREISWLRFNDRVHEEAADERNPLLERLRFLLICESNLDEFFMVRVAGLKQKLVNEIQEITPDGFNPAQSLSEIARELQNFYRQTYNTLNNSILPEINRKGIYICKREELSKADTEALKKLFQNEIFPILTPLAIDPGHPFPRLMNRSLNLAVMLQREEGKKSSDFFAVVQVPSLLPRLYLLPSSTAGKRKYIWLEEIIELFLDQLFAGFTVNETYPFKVTRDSDLIIEEDEADNLLLTIQLELRRREKGSAVRLEVREGTPDILKDRLKEALDLTDADVYYCQGPLPLSGYKQLLDDPLLAAEVFKPFTSITPVDYDHPTQIFGMIRKNDLFTHHPFDSFSIVEDFLNAAADDPKVLGIKMTLYRTGKKSRILDALIRAARNGKQVTALVELKARFDEETNIQWAKRLEEEGIHVVYGLMGFKTHCKMALVVRKENEKILRYVHLSSGNYNSITSRIYTDTGLFTNDEGIAEDIAHLFNSITGYSKLPAMNKIFTSPGKLKKQIIRSIRSERDNAQAGKKSRIICKMNSLVDKDVITELYQASQAGVPIDLIIRGICCLRPGLPGVSENIKVRSIVGRLLEHSRIFFFENNGKSNIYISSADFMPRNFNRRIEIMFPIENERIREKITRDILPLYLNDNRNARELQSDGYYKRVVCADDKEISAQETLISRCRSALDDRENRGSRKKDLLSKEKKLAAEN